MPDPARLIDDALDGSLDATGWERLAACLRRDPAARAAWWTATAERAALHQALSESRGRHQHRRPLLLRRLAIAAGVLLVLGVGAALWPRQPTTIHDGGHRLELAHGSRLHAGGGAHAWVLESGTLQVNGSGPLSIRTPHLSLEALGTAFTLTVIDGTTRISVQAGQVLLHAPGSDEEIEVGPGAGAVRGNAWSLTGARRWRPLFDANGAIHGRDPVKTGGCIAIDGRAALLADPTLVLHRADGRRPELPREAVVDIAYHLAAPATIRQAPVVGLHRYQEDQGIHHLVMRLPPSAAGWQRVRLPLSAFRSQGDTGAAGWLETVIISQAQPACAITSLRVLVPE